MKDWIPQKEDGSLDIEAIDKLPIDEYMDVIGSLTEEQYDYYESHTSMKPGTGTTVGMVVDYSMEDEIKRGTGVNFKEYLDNWKRD